MAAALPSVIPPLLAVKDTLPNKPVVTVFTAMLEPVRLISFEALLVVEVTFVAVSAPLPSTVIDPLAESKLVRIASLSVNNSIFPDPEV